MHVEVEVTRPDLPADLVPPAVDRRAALGRQPRRRLARRELARADHARGRRWPTRRCSAPSLRTVPDAAVRRLARELAGGDDVLAAADAGVRGGPRARRLRARLDDGAHDGGAGARRRAGRLPGPGPRDDLACCGRRGSRAATSPGTWSARAAPTPGSRSSCPAGRGGPGRRLRPDATAGWPATGTSPSPWAATTSTCRRRRAGTPATPRACSPAPASWCATGWRGRPAGLTRPAACRPQTSTTSNVRPGRDQLLLRGDEQDLARARPPRSGRAAPTPTPSPRRARRRRSGRAASGRGTAPRSRRRRR